MSDPEIIGPNDRFDDPFSDEAFDEPRPGMSMRAKLFATGAVVIGLVAVVAVGWFAFQQGIRSGAEEAAPVVRAATEPFKRPPADPGGLDVPHQDKLVFNRLAPGQVQEPVERLLPPPEEPVERPVAPEVAPAPETPAIAAPQPQPTPEIVTVPERVPAQPVPTPSINGEPPSQTAVAPPPPPAPAPAVEPEPTPAEPAPAPVAAAPAPKPEAKPAPAEKPAPAAAAGPAWKIQLASVSSRASAESEWTRMQGKNQDLLGSLALNVQTVTLDRGTFYRIQAGPLADRAAASSLCGQLKSRNQDCLIVAP